MLKRRTFLEPENSDNLIWALTVDQLRLVLIDEELTPFVFDLTAMSRRDLQQELTKFRDIRNIVAHQRATTRVTFDNFVVVAERLNLAIRHFKRDFLYPAYSDQAEPVYVTGEGDDDEPMHSVPGGMGEFFAASGLARGRQFIVSDVGRFFDYQALPVDPDMATGGFVDVASLLDEFHDVRKAILCIRVPHRISQGGLSVSWPKDVSEQELTVIRDACLSVRATSQVPYTEQDPKHICDPMIWFEQGAAGGELAGSALAAIYKPFEDGLEARFDDELEDDVEDNPDDG